uniref:Uncharacterized protein n=2 Tax=Vibrionaceae TaxID=641 RepID=H1A9B3_PHODD|nr:hypothetical protein [Photobacterium damselae subsp. damselae]BAO48270.1 hypothetical protein [Vibrio sp. 04Ya090]
MVVELTYPVLLVSKKKKSVHVELTGSHLGKCTNAALKGGYFNQMEIYDSNGRHYKVDEVVGVKPLNAVWRWPLEVLMFNSRLLKAELKTTLVSQLELKEFKSVVAKVINEQKESWESGVGREAMLNDLAAANGIEEVIRIFRPEN